MPRDDRRFDERVKSNRDAAEELDAVARHSAASNGFGAPEVALPKSSTSTDRRDFNANPSCQT
jgi:hypothetical protein